MCKTLTAVVDTKNKQSIVADPQACDIKSKSLRHLIYFANSYMGAEFQRGGPEKTGTSRFFRVLTYNMN